MREVSEPANNPRQQFEQRCTQYRRDVYFSVLRSTRNPADAEEIAQEALLHLWAYGEKELWNGGVENEKAYLMGIARNLCTDLWKRRKREGHMSPDDEQARKALDRKAEQQSKEFIAGIEAGIDYKKLYELFPSKIIFGGLSDYEFQILHLNKVDELPVKEIASIVGKDVYQVGHDLNKLMAKIRARAKATGFNPFE